MGRLHHDRSIEPATEVRGSGLLLPHPACPAGGRERRDGERNCEYINYVTGGLDNNCFYLFSRASSDWWTASDGSRYWTHRSLQCWPSTWRATTWRGPMWNTCVASHRHHIRQWCRPHTTTTRIRLDSSSRRQDIHCNHRYSKYETTYCIIYVPIAIEFYLINSSAYSDMYSLCPREERSKDEWTDVLLLIRHVLHYILSNA